MNYAVEALNYGDREKSIQTFFMMYMMDRYGKIFNHKKIKFLHTTTQFRAYAQCGLVSAV